MKSLNTFSHHKPSPSVSFASTSTIPNSKTPERVVSSPRSILHSSQKQLPHIFGKDASIHKATFSPSPPPVSTYSRADSTSIIAHSETPSLTPDDCGSTCSDPRRSSTSSTARHVQFFNKCCFPSKDHEVIENYPKHNITYLLKAYRQKYLFDTDAHSPKRRFTISNSLSMEELYGAYFEKVQSYKEEVRQKMLARLRTNPTRSPGWIDKKPNCEIGVEKSDSTFELTKSTKSPPMLCVEKSRSKSYKSGLTVERRRTAIEEMEERQKRSQKARDRFFWACRIIRTVNRWVRAVILHAAMFHPPPHVNKKSPELLDDVEYKCGTDESKSDSDAAVTFDKSYFKVRREPEHHIPSETCLLLSTPTSERDEDTIKRAVKSLQHMSTFAEYPRHMQEKLVMVGWFETVSPNRVIIRQMHQAENFYFILSGSVVVTILDKDPLTGEGMHRAASVLRKGSSFGELALLYQSRRTATVTSRETTHLLTVGRDAFFDIFASAGQPGQHSDHIKFLKTMDFMKNWPIEKLVEKPEMCLTHYFRRNQVMTQDGGPQDTPWIYVIKTGSCDVLKSLKDAELYESHKPFSRKKPPDSFLLSSAAPQSKTDSHLDKSRLLDEATNKKTNQSKMSVQQKKNKSFKSKFVTIQHLNPRDTFGLSYLFFQEDLPDYKSYEVSLVSRGAECVMVNKAYYMQYADDEVKKRLRFLISRYPNPTSIPQLIKNERKWQKYKNNLVKTISNRRNRTKLLTDFMSMLGHGGISTELPDEYY